jgi:hypothetical protein
MLKVVHDECEPNATCAAGAVSSSFLNEIVRDGARQMLAAAFVGGGCRLYRGPPP